MRFHALLPVRDEGDIIAQCIKHLLTWADAIYVFDTGSEDQTWDWINEIAHREKRVTILGRRTVYFSDALVRGWMFNVAREHMRPGDWFLRVDADEFHHIPPPEFVRRMRRFETIAYHQYYDFQLTESEAKAWFLDTDKATERARPIEERRRYFTPSVYSEPRLCKYRETMRWPPSTSFPINAGYVARERLPIRHYPHRDPEQLCRRCALRRAMMASKQNNRHWSKPELHHWSQPDWAKFVAPDNLPNLHFWAPGAPLPSYQFDNHLAQQPKRLLQRLVHSCLLPLLDRSRPRWPSEAGPLPIEDIVAARLSRELHAHGELQWSKHLKTCSSDDTVI
jgi:hypothetical protein